MTVTTDLSKFGHLELRELELLLKAWRMNGLPPDFDNDEVVPMFNMDSGYVFLSNSNYQVAMHDNNKLYSFYSCPECGKEGSYEDMHNPDYNPDDGEDCCETYLKDCRGDLYEE